MRRLAIFMLLAPLAMPAFAKQLAPFDFTCDRLAAVKDDGEIAADVKALRNVVIFDHPRGQVVWPAPAKLEVPDRGVFVIVFRDTDPTQFDYSIDLLDETAAAAKVDVTVTGTAQTRTQNNAVCISWRHLEEFPLYKVRITGRATAKTGDVEDAKAKLSALLGAGSDAVQTLSATDVVTESSINAFVEKIRPPHPEKVKTILSELSTELLYPYTFLVWVETAGPQLSFSTGLGFSDLKDQKFFVKEEADGTSTVERDRAAEDSFRPDLMAFATVSWKLCKQPWCRSLRLGPTAGVGLNGNDGDPRYFFGVSVVLGTHLVLSGGAFGAKVAGLPKGQGLGEAPISPDISAQLETGDKRFRRGWGISASWLFGKGKEEFLAGVGSGGQAKPTEKTDNSGGDGK